jgi:hypothetical protein
MLRILLQVHAQAQPWPNTKYYKKTILQVLEESLQQRKELKSM